MPAQYAFLNEVHFAGAKQLVRSVSTLAHDQPRCRGVLFLRWLAQVFWARVCPLFLDELRNIDRWLAGDELTWYEPGFDRRERRAVPVGHLGRDRIFRGVSLSGLYRSADPAGRLGDRAAAQGRRPRAGGETALTLVHLIALAWFYCLGIGSSGDAVVPSVPAGLIARPSSFAGQVHASRTGPGEGSVRQALRGKLSLVRPRGRHGQAGQTTPAERISRATGKDLEGNRPVFRSIQISFHGEFRDRFARDAAACWPHWWLLRLHSSCSGFAWMGS